MCCVGILSDLPKPRSIISNSAITIRFKWYHNYWSNMNARDYFWQLHLCIVCWSCNFGGCLMLTIFAQRSVEMSLIICNLCPLPYPEPVYTGWSSVHWNATGMPLIDPVYTGIPLEKLNWNSPTLECHWRNLVESAPHWDATGETLTVAAYTGTPLEGLWQPTHAPTHIVKYAE